MARRPDRPGVNAKGNLPGIDKGWNYAPGASLAQQQQQIVANKAANLPTQLAQDFKKDMSFILPPEAYIKAGKEITSTLPANDMAQLYNDLMALLNAQVGTGRAATIASSGKGADLVRQASRHYPASWVAEADNLGPLYTKLNTNGRGWHHTIDNSQYPVGTLVNFRDFGVVTVEKNAGYIVVRDDVGNAIHEYAHRLQNAHPRLQKLFKELHLRRTGHAPLESLDKLEPLVGYGKNELTRRDHYIKNYWGKEYGGEPLEVMTMGFKTVLSGYKTKESGKWFEKLYNNDREIFDFVVGILFNWKP
ncbi:MAG: hypothetical protein LBO00_04730 [Zoogloeaceae bacterium]|nr:hypothetical protein [Zoogloeaceae bacterium]